MESIALRQKSCYPSISASAADREKTSLNYISLIMLKIIDIRLLTGNLECLDRVYEC